MESIVEDVEQEREKEGSPTNSQTIKDCEGCDGSVYHYDILYWRHLKDNRRHCHTKNKLHY